MADFIPVRARFAGLDVTALQEFEPTDTIALALISGFPAGVTLELGNNSIDALADVDVPTPANNEVLTYNSVTGNWEAAVSPGNIAAVWGNITGTLSTQTDLQAALDLKADQLSLDNHTTDNTVHFTEGSIDHTAISNIGTNTHAQIDTHIADGTIHYTDAPTDAQDYVRNNNAWVVATSATFGEYIGPFNASTGSFPSTTNQGDWFNVTVAGTVDGQSFIVGDILIALVDSPSALTFAGNWTVVPNVSITDHTLLTNIGTNTHAQIDTHIADSSIHFPQSAISITKSQVSDFVESDYATGAEGDLATSAMQDLINDPSPQMGGNLDMNGFSIIANGGVAISATELSHLDSINSNIQTQLDGKLGSTATATNSQLLDGLDSTQFLRSDAADNYRGLYQSKTGVPTSNLGNPSITEMALFKEQFGNKTEFYDIANVDLEYTLDGITWLPDTSVSDLNKRRLIGGDSNSWIPILNTYNAYRITFHNDGKYVFLNALYCYAAVQGADFQVNIWKKHNAGSWIQHTTSTATVDNWPGHIYLPFHTIPFHPSGTNGTHYNSARVVITPTVHINNAVLYTLSLHGGYPKASHRIYSVNETKQVTFPESVSSLVPPTSASHLTRKDYVDGNFLGITAKAADSDLLDGYNLSQPNVSNTVVRRDGSGDITSRLFRSEYDTTNSNINFIMTQVDTATNNYVRPSTPLQLRTSLINDTGTLTTDLLSASKIISELSGKAPTVHTHPVSDVINLQTALDTKVETASNVGAGDGVFAQKVAQDLEFKTLVPGDGVQITPSASEILIEARRDKFFAHNGPVTQTFATGIITVLFPTVVRSDAAYTYNAGAVTINTAGWYFIEYQLSADNTGSSQSGSEVGIMINQLLTFHPGSLGYAYHRTSSTGKGSFTGRILVQLAVNDVIRVRTHRDGGGSTLETLPDGCRLTIIGTGAP